MPALYSPSKTCSGSGLTLPGSLGRAGSEGGRAAPGQLESRSLEEHGCNRQITGKLEPEISPCLNFYFISTYLFSGKHRKAKIITLHSVIILSKTKEKE